MSINISYVLYQIQSFTHLLEQTLKQKFKAQGKNLHELVTSVESQLGPSLVNKLRHIANAQNQVISGEADPVQKLHLVEEDYKWICDHIELIQQRQKEAANRIQQTANTLAQLLVVRLNANGSSLYDKINSVTGKIDLETVRKMNFIATIAKKTFFDEVNATEMLKPVEDAFNAVYKSINTPKTGLTPPDEPKEIMPPTEPKKSIIGCVIKFVALILATTLMCLLLLEIITHNVI